MHQFRYHELNVTAHDVELVLHGELAIEVQQNKRHSWETDSRAGEDAAPQGTVESWLLHSGSHLLQEGVGSNVQKTEQLLYLLMFMMELGQKHTFYYLTTLKALTQLLIISRNKKILTRHFSQYHSTSIKHNNSSSKEPKLILAVHMNLLKHINNVHSDVQRGLLNGCIQYFINLKQAGCKG